MIRKIFVGMPMEEPTTALTRARVAAFFVAWIFALVVAASPARVLAASAATELRAVELTQSGGGVRITLATSSATSHTLFTLNHPYRVVIDLRKTRLASGVRLPEGVGIVDTVRVGDRPGGALRVVLELKSPAPARGRWLAARGVEQSEADHRFVVALGRNVAFESDAAVENAAPRTVRAAHAPTDGDRDVIVAVDAGHGGTDPGAIGRNGTREKDITLAIARSLAARINGEPGMRAVLIRASDHFVVLRDRMVRARTAKADLFVSIHADSIRDRSITGSSVYVLSERGASSEAARWLAERENAADLMGGVKLDDKEESLASVLLDLSQAANLSASMTAAERVLSALDSSVGVRKSRVQQAGLVVLKSPDIPSMLVETGYISNPSEEARLRSSRHQARLAETIFSGLRGYFEVSPPPGTRLARMHRSTLAGIMASPPSTATP
jgi:N-acetylmuramoyl-L-alanine amidase